MVDTYNTYESYSQKDCRKAMQAFYNNVTLTATPKGEHYDFDANFTYQELNPGTTQTELTTEHFYVETKSRYPLWSSNDKTKVYRNYWLGNIRGFRDKVESEGYIFEKSKENYLKEQNISLDEVLYVNVFPDDTATIWSFKQMDDNNIPWRDTLSTAEYMQNNLATDTQCKDVYKLQRSWGTTFKF